MIFERVVKQLEIITNATDFKLENDTAVAMGKFDGVHMGHRRLLEEILARKAKGLAACVFTFDPAPAVLFGQSDGRELTTREEKRVLFRRIGVDILIEFPLDRQSAAILPEEFAREVLARRMNVRFLAAGTDLSFGAGGRGNAGLLQKMAPECGFTVKTIPKVLYKGQEISSTGVRSRIEEGDMEVAEQMLGMPYTIMGKVTHGKKLGRTLGMPTVNLIPPAGKLMPPNGVYFSVVTVRGKRFRAISNIGCKPTVTDERLLGVESYLYDFDEDVYGEEIEVGLLKFRRKEKRFSGVGELKAAMMEDISAGRGFEP